MGSVVIRGTAGRNRLDTSHAFKRSSEEDARRQFEGYKVTTYVKGDTAWVVGEWQGGHRVMGRTYLRIYKGQEHTLRESS